MSMTMLVGASFAGNALASLSDLETLAADLPPQTTSSLSLASAIVNVQKAEVDLVEAAAIFNTPGSPGNGDNVARAAATLIDTPEGRDQLDKLGKAFAICEQARIKVLQFSVPLFDGLGESAARIVNTCNGTTDSVRRQLLSFFAIVTEELGKLTVQFAPAVLAAQTWDADDFKKAKFVTLFSDTQHTQVRLDCQSTINRVRCIRNFKFSIESQLGKTSLDSMGIGLGCEGEAAVTLSSSITCLAVYLYLEIMINRVRDTAGVVLPLPTQTKEVSQLLFKILRDPPLKFLPQFFADKVRAATAGDDIAIPAMTPLSEPTSAAASAGDDLGIDIPAAAAHHSRQGTAAPSTPASMTPGAGVRAAGTPQPTAGSSAVGKSAAKRVQQNLDDTLMKKARPGIR